MLIVLLLFLPLRVLSDKSNGTIHLNVPKTPASLEPSTTITIKPFITTTTVKSYKNLIKSSDESLENNRIRRNTPQILNSFGENERKPMTSLLDGYYNSRDRRNQIIPPLSEEFSGMQIWNRMNLSGRRERPFYVEEPLYKIVRREIDYPEIIGNEGNDFFIPPRGRRDYDTEIDLKRDTGDIIFNNKDLFVPNRGKKEFYQIKRGKSNEILLPNDLFFPNRGKKDKTTTTKHQSITNLLDADDLFYPNRGKKTSKLSDVILNDDLFYPNRGKRSAHTKNQNNDDEKNYLLKRNNFKVKIKNEKLQKQQIGQQQKHKQRFIHQQRNKRDLLDNLSKEKDTFYSARGRRNEKNHFSPPNYFSYENFKLPLKSQQQQYENYLNMNPDDEPENDKHKNERNNFKSLEKFFPFDDIFDELTEY